MIYDLGDPTTHMSFGHQHDGCGVDQPKDWQSCQSDAVRSNAHITHRIPVRATPFCSDRAMYRNDEGKCADGEEPAERCADGRKAAGGKCADGESPRLVCPATISEPKNDGCDHWNELDENDDCPAGPGIKRVSAGSGSDPACPELTWYPHSCVFMYGDGDDERIEGFGAGSPGCPLCFHMMVNKIANGAYDTQVSKYLQERNKQTPGAKDKAEAYIDQQCDRTVQGWLPFNQHLNEDGTKCLNGKKINSGKKKDGSCDYQCNPAPEILKEDCKTRAKKLVTDVIMNDKPLVSTGCSANEKQLGSINTHYTTKFGKIAGAPATDLLPSDPVVKDAVETCAGIKDWDAKKVAAEKEAQNKAKAESAENLDQPTIHASIGEGDKVGGTDKDSIRKGW